MTITHKLTLDMQCKGELQRFEVVQGDALTRQVDLVLRCGGEPWMIPVCQPVVRYLKPDGTAGIYDTLPDGSSAISYAGNTMTLTLAPQMLMCAGPVQVQVELNHRDLKLSTFTFLVLVEPGVALDGKSEDYVNWTKAFLPQIDGAREGCYLRICEVDDAGRAVALEAAEDPTAALQERMVWMEDQFSGVAQRAEDARLDAVDALQQAQEAKRSASGAVQLAEQAIPAPQTAGVGQFLQVSGVDAQGKVTALVGADVQAGGGGNTCFVRQDFSVPEDANGFDIQLPVPAKNLIMYNLIIIKPPYDTSVENSMVYAFHGGNNIALTNVTTTGSLNISGLRFGDYIYVTVTSRKQDQYYEHTYPALGASVNPSGRTILGAGDKITLINMTDGVFFPAGTQVKFWGVYFNENL